MEKRRSDGGINGKTRWLDGMPVTVRAIANPSRRLLAAPERRGEEIAQRREDTLVRLGERFFSVFAPFPIRLSTVFYRFFIVFTVFRKRLGSSQTCKAFPALDRLLTRAAQ